MDPLHVPRVDLAQSVGDLIAGCSNQISAAERQISDFPDTTGTSSCRIGVSEATGLRLAPRASRTPDSSVERTCMRLLSLR